jgi:uncharacterized protein (TIGR02145 family)
MRKLILIFLLVFALLKTQAQDYLISFLGSGAASTISSVKVDNLTSGASVTLNSGDILHLSSTVGIDEPLATKGKLEIYPNPVTELATLSFDSPESSKAIIRVSDVTGRTICQASKFLSPDRHSFKISGISEGTYFVSVTGNGYTYSSRIISLNQAKQEARIEYISSSHKVTGSPLKSTEGTVPMLYKTGDQLLYKGISGIYSTIVPDVPTGNKTVTFIFVACTDKDNNNYSVVQVDKQTWMAENLKTTRYNDDTSIPLVQDNSKWSGLSTPGYSWFNNDSVGYKNTYGAIYNWYTVNTAKLAPAGWHIPSQAEWSTLAAKLGGDATASGKLKSNGTIEGGNGLWYSPNNGATNSSGFSAAPGGYRRDNGSCFGMGYSGYWWTITENDTQTAWYSDMDYSSTTVYYYTGSKVYGFSVRCVKD